MTRTRWLEGETQRKENEANFLIRTDQERRRVRCHSWVLKWRFGFAITLVIKTFCDSYRPANNPELLWWKIDCFICAFTAKLHPICTIFTQNDVLITLRCKQYTVERYEKVSKWNLILHTSVLLINQWMHLGNNSDDYFIRSR